MRTERDTLAEAATGGRVVPATAVSRGDRYFGPVDEVWDGDAVEVTYVAKDLKGRARLTFAHSETRTFDPQRKVVVA